MSEESAYAKISDLWKRAYASWNNAKDLKAGILQELQGLPTRHLPPEEMARETSLLETHLRLATHMEAATRLTLEDVHLQERLFLEERRATREERVLRSTALATWAAVLAAICATVLALLRH